MQNEKTITVLELENPNGKWIGNISIDVDTMEIKSYLKEGYNIKQNKRIGFTEQYNA